MSNFHVCKISINQNIFLSYFLFVDIFPWIMTINSFPLNGIFVNCKENLIDCRIVQAGYYTLKSFQLWNSSFHINWKTNFDYLPLIFAICYTYLQISFKNKAENSKLDSKLKSFFWFNIWEKLSGWNQALRISFEVQKD